MSAPQQCTNPYKLPASACPMSAVAWRPVTAADLPYPCSDPDCERAAVYLTESIPSESGPVSITACGEHLTGMAFAASAVKEGFK